MKRYLAVLAVLFTAFITLEASALQKKKPTHMDPATNPSDCAACHSGIGAKGTPLLLERSETICFRCHGIMSKGKASADIQSVFMKPSRHPVLETTIYHSNNEELPEKYPNVPRHVSCYDCHIVHITTPEKVFKGVKGYMPSKIRSGFKGAPPPGLKLKEAASEYELCYLCHSDSANLPVNSRNVSLDFDPTNSSYHPIEMPGRNKDVPSLITELNVNSVIMCIDCHGNDDRFGPRGPHGSKYKPLLVAEYRTEHGAESPKAYALCYMCHDRRSILQNESFRKHKEHVVFYGGGTSCNTCHASHGSRMSKNLIEFSALRVSPSKGAGGPNYLPFKPGWPRCNLNCHGAEHNALDENAGAAGKPWPQGL